VRQAGLGDVSAGLRKKRYRVAAVCGQEQSVKVTFSLKDRILFPAASGPTLGIRSRHDLFYVRAQIMFLERRDDDSSSWLRMRRVQPGQNARIW